MTISLYLAEHLSSLSDHITTGFLSCFTVEQVFFLVIFRRLPRTI